MLELQAGSTPSAHQVLAQTNQGRHRRVEEKYRRKTRNGNLNLKQFPNVSMTPVIGEREAIFPRDSDTDLPGHLSSVQKDPGSAADIITWLYPLILTTVLQSNILPHFTEGETEAWTGEGCIRTGTQGLCPDPSYPPGCHLPNGSGCWVLCTS